MNIQDKHVLLTRVHELLHTYMSEIASGERDVLNFSEPGLLVEKMDMKIGDIGSTLDDMLDAFSQVLDHSVATQHPLFFNQLYAAADPYGIAAEYIIAVLNTSMYTYEVGPLFTMMEIYVFDQIAQMIGREEHIGMMLPGGSTSNLYALQFARHKLAPHIRQSGVYGQQKFVIYTSDQAHYSLSKSAMLMGLGLDALITIKTNDDGCIDIVDLENSIIKSIQEGYIPLMINATSGTTVLGAYDNLEDVAHIAQKHDIWMHVDGIWGGTVIFHDKLKSKMKGLDLADSYSRNPHKMMGVPLQGSLFVTRHKTTVESCNVLKAPYLFQDERGYDSSYDTGDMYVQCGRRVDVLKLRAVRKAYGTSGIAQRVETAFDHAQYLKHLVDRSDRLLMVREPQCTNICFWYIPSHIDKNTLSREPVTEHYDEIDTINARIKEYMLKDGKMMIGIAHIPSKGLPYFFRMILINPEVTREHLDYVVTYIQEVGKNLEGKY